MKLTVLDRYIIKKYLGAFFFTMLMISMIAVTINYFELVDKFINAKLTNKQIFLDYYIYFIPWINGLLWPLFSLIAVIFFTSRLAKNSEIIPILSSKISYNRFLRPYLMTGVFLALLLWIGNNYVIPISNKKKNIFETAFIKQSNKQTLSRNIHFFLSQHQKLYLRNYSERDSSGRIFRLDQFDDDNKLISTLKANRITYIDSLKKWRLFDYQVRTINGLNESFATYSNTHIDTILQLDPQDFIRYSKQMEMMTTHDLKEFLAYEQNKGLDSGKKYSIELHRRTADPFTILILTLMGVSIASRKVRGGIGLHLAVGIIIGATFVIISKFATTFSTNLNLPPSIGVWLPNIVFSCIAYILYLKAQK